MPIMFYSREMFKLKKREVKASTHAFLLKEACIDRY